MMYRTRELVRVLRRETPNKVQPAVAWESSSLTTRNPKRAPKANWAPSEWPFSKSNWAPSEWPFSKANWALFHLSLVARSAPIVAQNQSSRARFLRRLL